MTKRDSARLGIAAMVVIAGVVSLTACDDNRLTLGERYVMCLESGGSWVEDAWGASCLVAEDADR